MLTTDEVSESDVIELEPASQSEPTGPCPQASAAPPRPVAAVRWWSEACPALRATRTICGGVACFRPRSAWPRSLACWSSGSSPAANPGTLTAEGSRFSLRVGFIGLRYLLAAAVAGLLVSKLPLSHKQLRRSSMCCSWV